MGKQEDIHHEVAEVLGETAELPHVPWLDEIPDEVSEPRTYEDEIDERVQAGTATPAECMWYEMQQYSDQDRREAAAGYFRQLLATIPEADRTPFVTNALKDGIDTTLGLKPLPEEGEK